MDSEVSVRDFIACPLSASTSSGMSLPPPEISAPARPYSRRRLGLTAPHGLIPVAARD